MYHATWAIGFILILIFFSTIRNLRGKSIWDRLLGLNLVSTKIIVIIVIFASYRNIDFLLDFAIIYGLTGFIGTIFVASFMADRMLDRKKGD